MCIWCVTSKMSLPPDTIINITSLYFAPFNNFFVNIFLTSLRILSVTFYAIPLHNDSRNKRHMLRELYNQMFLFYPWSRMTVKLCFAKSLQHYGKRRRIVYEKNSKKFYRVCILVACTNIIANNTGIKNKIYCIFSGNYLGPVCNISNIAYLSS